MGIKKWMNFIKNNVITGHEVLSAVDFKFLQLLFTNFILQQSPALWEALMSTNHGVVFVLPMRT
jgi:hypothetical protein